MKIALLADTPRLGGAEGVLVETARAAAEAGHTVLVLAPQPWLLEHVEQSVPAVRVREIGGEGILERPTFAGRAVGLFAPLGRLAGILRSERPDVLHVSNGGHPGSVICCLALPAARAAGVPRRVLSVHAGPRPRGEIHRRLEALLDPLVWGSAHVVAGATTFVGERLAAERGMPPALYTEVPYGVAEPPTVGAAELRARHAGPHDLLVAMVSASSDEQKGHAVLVDAVARAPDAVRALIVGADPPPAVRARVAELDIADRVHFLGRVDEVGPVLGAVDALVLPSVADESLPLVVLEAMAAGTAVLGSRLSGIPEAVRDGETGALFPAGDADALASLLAGAARDRDRLARWGEAARQSWIERWSPKAMAAATLALYERGPTGRR